MSVCVCVHACVHVCVYMCEYVRACARTRVCVCVFRHYTIFVLCRKCKCDLYEVMVSA